MNTTTLCYLLREGEVLLAMKKRGFGAGKWNGVGGKMHEGEEIREASVREVAEEISVRIAAEVLYVTIHTSYSPFLKGGA